MATAFNPSDQLKTCPYNKYHKVKASGFQIHISMCCDQYKNKKLKICPFNANHPIPEDKFEEHCLRCPDNISVLRSITSGKTPKLEPKEEDFAGLKLETKDLWSDQYITDHNDNTLGAYQVLSKEKLTAEDVFEKVYGRDNGTDSSFTDTLFVQMMSYEERKKYYALYIQRLKKNMVLNAMKPKDGNDSKDGNEGNDNEVDTHEERVVIKVEASNPDVLVKEERDLQKLKSNNVIQVPNTVPFPNRPATRLFGIGRGKKPFAIKKQSKAQDIVSALVTAMEQILNTNGYEDRYE